MSGSVPAFVKPSTPAQFVTRVYAGNVTVRWMSDYLVTLDIGFILSFQADAYRAGEAGATPLAVPLPAIRPGCKVRVIKAEQLPQMTEHRLSVGDTRETAVLSSQAAGPYQYATGMTKFVRVVRRVTVGAARHRPAAQQLGVRIHVVKAHLSGPGDSITMRSAQQGTEGAVFAAWMGINITTRAPPSDFVVGGDVLVTIITAPSADGSPSTVAGGWDIRFVAADACDVKLFEASLPNATDACLVASAPVPPLGAACTARETALMDARRGAAGQCSDPRVVCI